MKIGFDAKRFYRNQTGLGNYARATVQSLNTHHPDHEYVLFHDKPATTEGYKTVFPDSDQWRPIWRLKGIERQIRREDLNVYHGLSNEIPMIRWPKTVKKVVTIHDVIFRHFPNTYPLVDRTIYHTKVRYACSNANLILAVSEHTKTDLIRFYGVDPDRIDVLPIDTADHFYPTVERPSSQLFNQLVCISSFGKRKNIPRLIQAFHLVRDQVDFNLILAGSSGETLSDCRKLISKLKLDDRITIQTALSDEAIVNLYDQADGVVYPSLYEGFGLPILEAYRRGIPVLCSSTSSLPEVGGDFASYFKPDQVESIAHALRSFDLSKKNSSQFHHERLDWLMQFNRERLANRLIDLYKRD